MPIRELQNVEILGKYSRSEERLATAALSLILRPPCVPEDDVRLINGDLIRKILERQRNGRQKRSKNLTNRKDDLEHPKITQEIKP